MRKIKEYLSGQLLIIIVSAAVLLSACASHETITLMPTPVIYQDSSIDPFAHLNSEQKNTLTQVFYATNRIPRYTENKVIYGNDYDDNIHLGTATIRMGDQNSSWDDLHLASLTYFEQSEQEKEVILTLDEVVELAELPEEGNETDRLNPGLTPEQQDYINAINAQLSKAVDKEIMLFVHGTKTDFANAVTLTAEIDHFSGRDFVGVAFDWPSHQDILSYLTGMDVERALNSSTALKSFLMFLSRHTIAKQINILSYSAGGKVTSKALYELRHSFSSISADEVKKKFRLGTVVFAAADVGVDVFLDRLTAVSDLAQLVVITITDFDNALIASRLLMGGSFRASTSDAEPIEEQFIVKNHLSNVEIIDISMGQEVRQFDIIGHHYWYRHPWVSSDIIFLLRTDLPAHRRGLSATEMQGIWFLSPDYPQKVKKAAQTELEGQW